MNHREPTSDRHLRKTVADLLEAVDQAVAAMHEVSRAREALTRVAARRDQLRVVAEDSEPRPGEHR
jgi:hypothetical protein